MIARTRPVKGSGLLKRDTPVLSIFQIHQLPSGARTDSFEAALHQILLGTMTRMSTRPLKTFLIIISFLGAAGFVAQRREFDPVADAAPHTISDVDHPFDPDWPDVWLILAQKCNACHRSGTEQTDLTTWESIVDGPSVDGDRMVVPGRPEESLLWLYVNWNHSESSDSIAPDEPMMPPDREDWLTAGQLKSLARWIRNGALQYELPDTCSTRPLLEIDFPSARECRLCHPKQYTEWSRSMHAYAQHSPVFEAFNLTLQERTAGTLGTFCTRCHTPVGTALGENGQRRNVHRSRLSMEGVTCVVCHRIERPYYKSSTRRHIAAGKLIDGCMYGPFSDSVSMQEDAHDSTKLLSIRSSAFCGTCHDVIGPRGIRLEEAFSEWQNSPAARNQHTCQHCHMGPVQGQPIRECDRPLGQAATVPGIDPDLIPVRPLSDHTFAGPDYSLLPDTEFPEKLDWMYETDYRHLEQLTSYQKSTLNDLRRRNRRQLRIANAKRYELLQNAAEIRVSVPQDACCGDRAHIKVAVHSLVSGHNFPTGFTEERQLWVSVELCDPSGQRVFATGDFDHNGDLRDEHSHEVLASHARTDHHLLNFQSKFVGQATRGTERPLILSVNRQLIPLNFFRPATTPAAAFGRPVTFRIAKAAVAPLSTVQRNFPIQLPQRPGDYCLRVRLNYRHLPPHLLDEIGTPHLKPLLETVVIDECESVIHVGSRSAGLSALKRLAGGRFLR